MSNGRKIQWFGVGMLLFSIFALWFNVVLLMRGRGSHPVTAGVAVIVGVGVFVIGDIWREA